MKKVLAFGASNSKKSINKQFATAVANELNNVEIIVVDLNDYQLPIYSPDLEEELGSVHSEAIRFDKLLASVDGIIISLAEYNGSYTTAFKNIFDWVSRINMETTFKNKPMLLLSTSPGERGGVGVLSTFKMVLPYFGANLIADFSLSSFYDNFNEGNIVKTNEELVAKIKKFQIALQ